MDKKSKINWWVIIAILLIGVPIGFVGTGVINRFFTSNPMSIPLDSDSFPPPKVDSIIRQNYKDTVITDTTENVGKDNIRVSDSQITTPPTYKLSVNPRKVTIDANGGTKSITVQSNTDWRVSTTDGDDWLSTNSMGGNGSKEIILSTTENTSEITRTAKLELSWEDERGDSHSTSVSVNQKGRQPPTALFLTTKPNNVTFKTGGGNGSVIVKSNTSWKINTSEDVDWLTLSCLEGDGNKTITLKAIKNTGMDDRVAMLIFVWQDEKGNRQSSTVSVSQKKSTPIPITRSEVQTIVANGKTDGRVPDNCIITGNGINTTYGSFRSDIAKGKYSSVQVQTLTTDKATGNASEVKVKVATSDIPEPSESMTNEEALSIISSGKKNNKVPETCIIVINGKSKQYKKFRDDIDYGYISNIKVTNVQCDAKGNATKIIVSATVNEGDE